MVVVQSHTKQPEKIQDRQSKHVTDVSKLNFNTDEIQSVKKSSTKQAKPAQPAKAQLNTSHPAMQPAGGQKPSSSAQKDNNPKLDPNLDQIIAQVDSSYNAGKTKGAKTPQEQQKETDQKVDAIIEQLKHKHAMQVPAQSGAKADIAKASQPGNAEANPGSSLVPLPSKKGTESATAKAPQPGKKGSQAGTTIAGPTPEEMKKHPTVGPMLPNNGTDVAAAAPKKDQSEGIILNFGNDTSPPKTKETGSIVTNLPQHKQK